MRNRIVGLVLSAGFLVLAGCNPTVRATVEDGIITSSTALLGATLQALVQVVQEDSDS